MSAEQARDALVERLFGAALGAFDLMGVYLGDRLGEDAAAADAERRYELPAGHVEACGEGRSTLAMARGYPKVTADGLELDEASIEKLRRASPAWPIRSAC